MTFDKKYSKITGSIPHGQRRKHSSLRCTSSCLMYVIGSSVVYWLHFPFTLLRVAVHVVLCKKFEGTSFRVFTAVL